MAYGRSYANHKKDRAVAIAIRKELDLENSFIDNPNHLIMFYNYASIRDTVADVTGSNLTAQTVIIYAKKWGFYIERLIVLRVKTKS